MLAATIRVTGDIDVAEECVQDAFARALTSWPVAGVPERPGAWLTTVARRRAIDLLRRQSSHDRLVRVTVVDVDPSANEAPVADDRLRLIFTCCHPALASETQVALALRLLCGLTTAEVARAFLVSESTMAARITRGKKKIAESRIPYRVPEAAELPARVDAVLSAIYLVFTTGHTAPSGSDLMRRDLVDRSIQLARMVRELLPDDGSVDGLLALIVLTDARRGGRVGDEGTLQLLSEQDRSLWDHAAIAEGATLVRSALRRRPADRFALMAAIAAVHSQAPTWASTDWGEIIGLYDLLLVAWPSPVVALNRAVAIGIGRGPQAGLDALAQLGEERRLSGYNYLASARADFLRQLRRLDEARASYQEALSLSENEVERDFLTRRLRELDD